MIRVIRSPKPSILVQKEAEWLHALKNASTLHEKESALSKYRHKQIQQALDAMFHGKCAYCESHIKHVSAPHIEHYRPKSKFPELAFDWDNLLLACGMCNSPRYKGDKFPDAAENGPIINPCSDEPDDHFTFDYDPDAQLASVYGKTKRGETTEKLLGLNQVDLRTYRSKQVKKLYVLASFAKTEPEAQKLLDEARQDGAEYAAFARKL